MFLLFPMMMRVAGRRCVVVGGGEVALRKVQGLLEAGAQVHVVSLAVAAELKELPVSISLRDFEETDLAGAALVFAATDDEAVNRRVMETAQARNVPVNVADAPDLCTFFMPATLRRGDMTIAISTAGATPALARSIREHLEEQFGPEYEDFVCLLGEFRRKILDSAGSAAARRTIFNKLGSIETFRRYQSEGRSAVERLVREWFETSAENEDLN